MPLPALATAGSAGADIRAVVDPPVVLSPGERALVPTGLMFAVPRGYELQVRPRSGLAADHGVTVLNAPGTIDSDFRGEVKVLLVNLGTEPVTITRGMRIAQLVVGRVCDVSFDPVPVLDETLRSDGGFGHTGST